MSLLALADLTLSPGPKALSMNCLIIGGTNFIGPLLVNELIDKECQVTLFNRGNNSDKVPSGVNVIKGDKSELVEYKEQFKDLKLDVVIHMMANTESEAAVFAEAFTGVASNAVVLSSANLYKAHSRFHMLEEGSLEACPIAEDAPLRKVALKEDEKTEKAAVEKTLVTSELPTTILRVPPIYGPQDPKTRFYPMIMRMLEKRPFILVGEQQSVWRWTHGYVANIAHGIAVCALNPGKKHRLFNLGEQSVPTVKERMEHLATMLEWDGKVLVMPDDDLPPHLRTPGDFRQNIIYDTSRIRAELEYVDTFDYYEGIREAALWYAENPPSHLKNQKFNYESEDQAAESIKT